ncbi:MAG: hypothetical protein WEC75_13805 [Dehalococcoidia bacterium]
MGQQQGTPSKPKPKPKPKRGAGGARFGDEDLAMRYLMAGARAGVYVYLL